MAKEQKIKQRHFDNPQLRAFEVSVETEQHPKDTNIAGFWGQQQSDIK